MAPPKDDPGNLNVSHPTFKPNPLPQIPALPPPAQGWPTPWLGRSGIEEYLHPLYKRGWKPSVQESSVKGKESTFLSAEYAFKKFDEAVKFVGDVGVIAHDEDVRLSLLSLTVPSFPTHALGVSVYMLQHHPSTITITHSKKTTKVSLVTQTHAAKRPAPAPAESAESPPSYVRVPGITIRDVRFAILVESHYGAGYESEEVLGDKVHAATVDSEDVTGERWDEIVDRLVPE